MKINYAEYEHKKKKANEILSLATNDKFTLTDISYNESYNCWFIDDGMVSVPYFKADTKEIAMLRATNYIIENESIYICDMESEYWIQDARDYAISLRF